MIDRIKLLSGIVTVGILGVASFNADATQPPPLPHELHEHITGYNSNIQAKRKLAAELGHQADLASDRADKASQEHKDALTKLNEKQKEAAEHKDKDGFPIDMNNEAIKAEADAESNENQAFINKYAAHQKAITAHTLAARAKNSLKTDLKPPALGFQSNEHSIEAVGLQGEIEEHHDAVIHHRAAQMYRE